MASNWCGNDARADRLRLAEVHAACRRQSVMNRALVSMLLVVVGIIHLLPLPGVFGSSQLSALYGLDLGDPNLAILLRHRAVLFGLLAIACLTAAFRRDWQDTVIAATGVSAVAFLLIAGTTGQYNAAIGRVVTADIVAVACLVMAASLRLAEARRNAARRLR